METEDGATGASVGEIFDDSLPQVYGYLLRRLGSRDLAEELTATTFVRATSACSRGKVDTCTTAWLITIARNLLVDHWRHRAVVARAAVLTGERPPPHDPWDEVLDAARAESLLANLKPEHRSVLTLRYLDDLPVAAVADALDRSVRATESLLVRARASLRAEYEATGGDR